MTLIALQGHSRLNKRLRIELYRELLRLRHAFEVAASHELRQGIATRAVLIGDLLQIEIGGNDASHPSSDLHRLRRPDHRGVVGVVDCL